MTNPTPEPGITYEQYRLAEMMIVLTPEDVAINNVARAIASRDRRISELEALLSGRTFAYPPDYEETKHRIAELEAQLVGHDPHGTVADFRERVEAPLRARIAELEASLDELLREC